MPIPTLPQELVDVIIDHLRDDRAALATCSVSCKAWLSRSRSHLMADFSISPYDLIIDAVDIASIFSPYTRNLLLNFYAYSLPHEIDLFPSITSLYIMRSEINQGMQYRLSAAFTLITHLELRNTRFAAFDVLANLLCSIPRIQTVMLVGCSWLKETEPSARISPPRGWHTLSIDLSSLDTFLAWFTSLDPLPTLSRLRIDQPHEEHLKHVGAAIRALGTSLRYLTIVLWHADRAAEHINLSRNADLRSLELLCNGSPKLLHDILATHTLRTQLQEVKLGLFMSTLMNSSASDWIDLDSLLANAATKFRLSSFTIRVEFLLSPDVPQVIVDMCLPYLPSCHGLGIIRFVSESHRQEERRQRLTSLGHLALRVLLRWMHSARSYRGMHGRIHDPPLHTQKKFSPP